MAWFPIRLAGACLLLALLPASGIPAARHAAAGMADPWYVVLLANPTQASGNVTASIQRFASAAAYRQTVGADPASVGVPGQTGAGFPTQAAAQAVADAWNKSGQGQHATGSKPLAPSVAAPAISTGVGAGDVIGQAANLLHGVAEVLDQVFYLFAPGQGWRIVFGAGAIVTGIGAGKAYISRASFPVSVGLASVSLMCAFMALRSWPQEGGGAEKPGEYIAQILTGHPPAPGQKPPHETDVIEAGLAGLIAVWIASKLAGGIGGALGALGLGKAAAGGA